MKRFSFFVGFITLAFFFLPVIHQVSAGSASHDTKTIGGADTLKLIQGNIASFTLVGDVVPIVVKADENNRIDIKPISIWGATAGTWNQPMPIKNKTIPYTSENPSSAKYCAKLVIKFPWGSVPVVYDLTTSTTEVGANIEGSQQFLMAGDILSSVFGLQKKFPEVSGMFQYDRERDVVAVIVPGDCGMVDAGVAGIARVLGVRSHAIFESATQQTTPVPESVFTWVTKMIDGVLQTIKDYADAVIPMRVELTGKFRDSHVFNGWCYFGRCNVQNTDQDRTARSAKVNGSLAGSLMPLMLTRLPIDFDAIVDQTVDLIGLNMPGSKKSTTTFDLPNLNANSGMSDTKTSACLFTPLIMQAKVVFGDAVDHMSFSENCKQKELKCPIDVIDKEFTKASDTTCNVCNQSSAAVYMNTDQAKSFGKGLSPLALKVLQSAADTYKVPASVLLATMLHEGAFNAHNGASWVWSNDETIKQYSNCESKSPMPNCAGSTSIAVGPFGFIVTPWWNKYMENNKNPYDGKYHKSELKGMDEVIKNIPAENFNPCNFTDAAYMAAREISEDSSHVFETVPASCQSTDYGTITFYQGADIPQSCSAWTPERVATTRLQYAEGIDEGTCTPAGATYTNDIGRMVAMYGDLTCGK